MGLIIALLIGGLCVIGIGIFLAYWYCLVKEESEDAQEKYEVKHQPHIEEQPENSNDADQEKIEP